MLYACNTCEQTFWGFDRFMPQQCPECGRMTVRKATEEEQNTYELEQFFLQSAQPNGILPHLRILHNGV